MANYLSDTLGIDVRTQRSVSGGRQDGPDLVTVNSGYVSRTVCGFALEAKNARRFDLSGWVDQADHGGPFAVVVKRRQKPAGDAYVVTTLDVFAGMLAEVG